MTEDNLVAKAKSSKPPIRYRRAKRYPENEIELALAWARGDVTTAQCGRALETRGTSPATYLGYLLRAAFEAGKLIEP